MREKRKNKTLRDGVAVLILALALGARSLIGFFTAKVRSAWILSPWLFPVLLALLALPLSVALIREGCRELPDETPSASRLGKPALIVLLSVVYLLLMGLIGFLPATALFLAALLWLLGERRWWSIAAVAVLTPLVLYAIFALGLNVRLP